MSSENIGKLLVDLHGGKENIVNVKACITRLRVSIKDHDLVKDDEIKKLGAKSIIRDDNSVQSVFGAKADELRAKMQEALKS